MEQNKPEQKEKTSEFDEEVPVSRNLLLAVFCWLGVVLALTTLVFYEMGITRGENSSSSTTAVRSVRPAAEDYMGF